MPREFARRIVRVAEISAALLVGALAAVSASATLLSAQLPGKHTDGLDANGQIPASWHLDQCIAGVTYGGPHKLAAAWGGGLLRESNDGGDDTCLMAVGKVGLGAASASFGIGRSVGHLGGGVALTGGLLRTFSHSLNTTPRRNYVGGSLHVWPLVAIGGEIGYYVRVGDASGASDFQRHVITWSAGFGF